MIATSSGFLKAVISCHGFGALRFGATKMLVRFSKGLDLHTK